MLHAVDHDHRRPAGGDRLGQELAEVVRAPLDRRLDPRPRGHGPRLRPAVPSVGGQPRPSSTPAKQPFGAVTTASKSTSKSRPSSCSTAPPALSASSAATEQRPRLGFRRANRGRLDHSREPAAMPLSLASAHGGARPVASARVGNERSRFAGPRRRIRPEGPAQAKAAIRPHDSVRHSSPTSLWKLWKVRLWNRRRTLGFRAGGSATLRRSVRCEVTRTGEVREKPRKERELSQALPNVCHRLADRMAPTSSRRVTA